MLIDVEYLVDGKIRQLKTEHGEDELVWNVETYNRSNFQSPTTLFDNINNFFGSLEQEKRETIAAAYREIYNAFAEIADSTRLHKAVQDQVKVIYSQFDFDQLKRWCYIHGDLEMPQDLKADYSRDDLKSERTVKLTYLRDDYQDLAVMTIYLKPLVPIFGEYIQRAKDQIGTQFKEQASLSLLAKTDFFNLEPVKRLQTYIAAAIEQESIKDSAVFGGLGSSELPDWLLSRVLVRRVAVSEVNVGENVISNVYHTISQQLNSLDKTFRGRISSKTPTGTSQSQPEEDNVSVVENYKIKQQISDGDLAVLSVYTERPLDMAAKIDPTVDPQKVKLCVERSSKSKNLSIHQHQIVLTQWTLSEAISPRGVPLLKKPALLRALGVTQALLWHWGFVELAGLVIAEPKPDRDYAANFTPTRLSRSYIEEFARRFPHWRRTGSREQNQRHVNVACRAIDIISMQMVKTDWNLKGPVEIAKECNVDPDQPYIIPADIRHQLANLLIRINDNKKHAA